MDDDHGVLITAERMVDAFVPKDLREMNWVGVGVDCVIWIKDVKGRKRRDESRSGRRSDVDAGCEDDVSAASDESEPDVGDDEDEDEDDDEDGSNESGDVSMQMDVSKSMEDGPANDSEEEMEKLGERVGGIGFEQ